MPLTFLIVLATAHFKNANLVVFAMCHHRDTHRCTGHQGRADLQFCAAADCQNLIKHNLLANVRSNLFYFNFFACSNSVLFATGFYDRVHINLFNVSPRTNFRRAQHYVTSTFVRQSCLPTDLFSKPTGSSKEPRVGAFYNREQITEPTVLQATTPSQSSSISIIAADMHEVDRVIAQRLDSGVPLVGQVSRYIISAGGKRLRPALLLLICGALGFKGTQRFNLAAVVEFIHTATLLHDDVVDDSSMRRGNATANETFGNPASVLVGDFLYSRAFQMMVDAQSMRIMQVLADATNVIAEGEVMQLMNMHNAALDEVGYLQVIRSKTAKLFEASARVGAILAGAAPDVEQACAQYGQALGTAFQVIDDVLDYTGDAAVMGKNLGDDLARGQDNAAVDCRDAPWQWQQECDVDQKCAIETGDVTL
jgi:octaprenyl-diphosphate synthase